MTTTRLPTVVDPELSSVDDRARRPRWRRWVVVMLMAPLLAGTWWVLAYQPIATGGTSGAGRVSAVGYDAMRVEKAFGTEFRVGPPEPGDQIGLLFALENDGPLGITVVAIGNPFNPQGIVGAPIDWTTPTEATRSVGVTGEERIPLGPFALPAGGYTQVRLAFDVHDCATGSWSPGSSTTVDTVPVTYRVLGLTRTVNLPLRYALTIEEPCGR